MVGRSFRLLQTTSQFGLPPNNNSQTIILALVPQSQNVPTISPPFLFQSPSKKIHSLDDIRRFHESETWKLGSLVLCEEPSSWVPHEPSLGSARNPSGSCKEPIAWVPRRTQDDSFGNSSRIGYGTSHKTNFVAWLYCLARMGILKEEDYQAIVARVFVRYLKLMRKLQLVY